MPQLSSNARSLKKKDAGSRGSPDVLQDGLHDPLSGGLSQTPVQLKSDQTAKPSVSLKQGLKSLQGSLSKTAKDAKKGLSKFAHKVSSKFGEKTGISTKAYREDKIDAAVSALTYDDCWADYRPEMKAYFGKEYSLEVLEFIEAVEDGTMDNKTIYDTFVRRKSPKEINFGGKSTPAGQQADDDAALYEAGLYDSMEFGAIVADLHVNSTQDTYSRFKMSSELKDAVAARM